MRKLHIALIILFSCFILLALSANEEYPNDGGMINSNLLHLNGKRNIESALCLFETKSNLPQEYEGGNLKIEKIPTSYKTDAMDFSEFTGKDPYVLANHSPSLEYLTNIYVECENYEKTPLGPVSCYPIVSFAFYPAKYVISSYIEMSNNACKEYIAIYIDKDDIRYGYNVTNVPPGSYLKYIPQTQEVQVIPPSENSFKEIIEDEGNNPKSTYSKTIFGGFAPCASCMPAKPETFEYPLTAETYKEFAKTQSQITNKELINELKQVRKELKRKIIKDKVLKVLYGTPAKNKSTTRGIIICLILILLIDGTIALPFGNKFIGFVYLTDIITNSVFAFSIYHFNIESTEILIIFISNLILIKWGLLSLFTRKNYLKLFLFSLFTNILTFFVGLYLLSL